MEVIDWNPSRQFFRLRPIEAIVPQGNFSFLDPQNWMLGYLSSWGHQYGFISSIAFCCLLVDMVGCNTPNQKVIRIQSTVT